MTTLEQKIFIKTLKSDPAAMDAMIAGGDAAVVALNKIRNEIVVLQDIEHRKLEKRVIKLATVKAPQRPISAYMAYGVIRRPQLKEANPGWGFGDLTKAIANEWNAMLADQKLPYQRMADKDKIRYQMQCAEDAIREVCPLSGE